MQAKTDTLRVKDDSGEEYLLYPKTLMQCVTDEDGNTLVDALSNLGAISSDDIDTRFLTEEGYGELRYSDGKIQYYDNGSGTWVDAQATADNQLVAYLTPQPMRKFEAVYNASTSYVDLTILEPADTIVDGQALCIIDKVIIRRKKDTIPIDETDGDLVVEIPRKDFGLYSDTPYADIIAGAVEGETYCYKAFPVSAVGVTSNSSDNESSAYVEGFELYGFRINQNESNPASMITYLEDCDNANYQSAYMDYNTGTFNYGDWADAWFIKGLKPCMLNYDGTVAYELDTNDYTLKKDGTPSDIADSTFGGNAMVGIPKVYWKIIDNGDNTADVYISNIQIDSDYHCWSHIDSNGKEIDYCYMAIYSGSIVDSTLRSLSGTSMSSPTTFVSEMEMALNNNQTGDIIWNIETYADVTLLRLLLLLIGKSTDSQSRFGYGYIYGSGVVTGKTNNRGLFYGSNYAYSTNVKVFGLENRWGCIHKSVLGYLQVGGSVKVKMTYGQSDGSTVDGYNLTGDGYITVLENAYTVDSPYNGYIRSMAFTPYGFIPTAIGGSSSTYYPDAVATAKDSDPAPMSYGFPAVGATTYVAYAGILYQTTTSKADSTFNTTSCTLSCKPLATT